MKDASEPLSANIVWPFIYVFIIDHALKVSRNSKLL